MNRSLDVLKSIYKPYRITIKGSSTILETTSGTYVVKKKENNIKELYSYLLSRNFDYFPDLVDFSRDDVNVFKYVDGVSMPSEQKALDMINLVSLLHNKTSYYKEVTSDDYKRIYDNISDNIEYLLKYYSDYFDMFVTNEFLSPSEYLFVRNYYQINSCLLFCKSELDSWFYLVKEKNRQRVSLVHNNLELEHFIKGDRDYLISWDKAVTDSPILDIINLYHKDFYHIEFGSVLSNYLDSFSLSEDEKKLLFICLSMPSEISFLGSEISKCDEVRKMLDYIFKTEELLKPYYSKNEEK